MTARVERLVGRRAEIRLDLADDAVFDEGIRETVRPSARRMAVASIAARLAGTEPRAKTDIAAVVRRAAAEADVD